jgi:hypothetical protein
MEQQITILAAADIDTLEEKGADVEDNNFETVASAKKRARYLLTEEYRIASECSTRLGYSRVLVNGKCVADFFGETK